MATNKNITIVKADITKLDTDAIVNAAGRSLLGGGGVDGAIHRAAGPELLKECRKLNGCPTGEAKLTRGYNLPAKYVIHTVGPIWSGGNSGEPDLLASCYRNSLSLAKDNEFNSIAFPSISTGVYGYPFAEACKIAIMEIKAFLNVTSNQMNVILVTHSQKDFDLYNSVYDDFKE